MIPKKTQAVDDEENVRLSLPASKGALSNLTNANGESTGGTEK